VNEVRKILFEHRQIVLNGDYRADARLDKFVQTEFSYVDISCGEIKSRERRMAGRNFRVDFILIVDETVSPVHGIGITAYSDCTLPPRNQQYFEEGMLVPGLSPHKGMSVPPAAAGYVEFPRIEQLRVQEYFDPLAWKVMYAFHLIRTVNFCFSRHSDNILESAPKSQEFPDLSL
jgi:hypothetical protein